MRVTVLGRAPPIQAGHADELVDALPDPVQDLIQAVLERIGIPLPVIVRAMRWSGRARSPLGTRRSRRSLSLPVVLVIAVIEVGHGHIALCGRKVGGLIEEILRFIGEVARFFGALLRLVRALARQLSVVLRLVGSLLGLIGAFPGLVRPYPRLLGLSLG